MRKNIYIVKDNNREFSSGQCCPPATQMLKQKRHICLQNSVVVGETTPAVAEGAGKEADECWAGAAVWCLPLSS